MKPFKEQQQIDEAIDVKKALKKVKGLSDKQMTLISRLPMPVLTSIVNQLSAIVAQNDLEEKLVASDLTILDTILSKIKDDISNDKIKGKFEKSWPKMTSLARMAGYKITKKMQQKGKTYLWKLKK
tara:strand:- start:2562 stop:2939 length:378 start_codon:yes stop_codon:yes gene_type:complete